jgi:hypothetical protein
MQESRRSAQQTPYLRHLFVSSLVSLRFSVNMSEQSLSDLLRWTREGMYHSALLIANSLQVLHNTPCKLQLAYTHLLNESDLDDNGIALKAKLEELGAKEQRPAKARAADKRNKRLRCAQPQLQPESESAEFISVSGVSIGSDVTGRSSIMFSSVDI